MDKSEEKEVPGPSHDLRANQTMDLMDRRCEVDGANQRFAITAGNHGFCIIPEDFVEFDGINPCTFEPETFETPTFDYYDYMEFNRLRLLHFHVQNRKIDFLTRVKREKRDPEDVPSDKFMRSQFKQRFGAADFESQQLRKGFKVMEEYFMEQSDMDPEDPQIMLQLLDLDIEADDPIIACEELESLINRLYGDKMKLYSTMDPRHASAEWFVISRGHPGIVRERHLHQEVTVRYGGFPDTDEKPSGPLKNLHLYDPKFDLCFDWPYRVFTEDYEDWDILKDIPRLVAVKILKHLNKFPFGVTSAAFGESYRMEHGAQPQIGTMNLKQILDQLHEEIWFVGSPRPGLPELMFPGFLEDIVDPDIVLKRAWHAVNCLLGLNSFMLVDDVFEVMKVTYFFKFHPADWGFESMQSFVQYCNRSFGSMNLTVHRVIVTKGGKVHQFDYLLIDSNYWKRHVERLHGIPDADLPRAKPVPKHFLELGDTIPAFSNYLNPTEHIIGDLKYMHNPYDMYFVPREFGKRLDHFMTMMQSHMDVIRATTTLAPRSESILVGMYVLVFIQRESNEPQRWHRMRVIGKKKTGSSFCVYSIDYGFQWFVELKDIRLMPHGVISKEMAYAVPIRLKLLHPNRKSKFKHPKKTTTLIYDIIRKDILQVRLRTCKFKQLLGCLKWKVDCNVVTRYPNLKVKIPDLQHMFYEDYAKFKTKLVTKRQRRNARKAAKLATEQANLEEQAAKLPTENASTEIQAANVPTESSESAIQEVQTAKVPIENVTTEVQAADVPIESVIQDIRTADVPNENATTKVQTANVPIESAIQEVQTANVLNENVTMEVQAADVPTESSESAIQEVQTAKVPNENVTTEVQAADVPIKSSIQDIQTAKVLNENATTKLQATNVPIESAIQEVQTAKVLNENVTMEVKAADVPTESIMSEVHVAEVSSGNAIQEVKAAKLPFGKAFQESNAAKTDDGANHVSEIDVMEKDAGNKDGVKMAIKIVAGIESEDDSSEFN